MPRRQILTKRQREAIFSLPKDQSELTRHYTLNDEDLLHIAERRGAHNRMGFALQLCALRHPGRLLNVGETISIEVARFIGTRLARALWHETTGSVTLL